MKGQDVVRLAMTKRGETHENMAKKLGYANQSGFTNILQRQGSMRLDNLYKILNELDYEIRIAAKGTGEVLAVIKEPQEKKKKKVDTDVI